MMTLIFEGLCSCGRKREDRREGEECQQWGEERVMCTRAGITSCTLTKAVGALFLPHFLYVWQQAVINTIIEAQFCYG